MTSKGFTFRVLALGLVAVPFVSGRGIGLKVLLCTCKLAAKLSAGRNSRPLKLSVGPPDYEQRTFFHKYDYDKNVYVDGCVKTDDMSREKSTMYVAQQACQVR